MKLACADFTWPLLPHDRVLQLIRLLDVEGVDLGLFGGRSHIRPEVVRADLAMWAGILKERIARSGLELADFFFQPWTDFETMAPNHPDPARRSEADALFRDMLELARRLDAPGMTMLPGVRFGDESWDTAIRRSAEALAWRVEALCIVEPSNQCEHCVQRDAHKRCLMSRGRCPGWIATERGPEASARSEPARLRARS